MGKKEEIRGGRKAKLLGAIVGWICRLLGFTYRVKIIDHAGVRVVGREEPVVCVFWHNKIFATLASWQKISQNFPAVALVSASKDGTILENAVRVVGAETARGSSSRRGAAALIAMRNALREGKDAYITPDGPRGPKYQLQVGALKLAQLQGVPLIVKHLHLTNYWEIKKSWDGLRIPKPFSKIEIVYDAPIHIPQKISEEELENIRCEIEQQMRESN